LIDANDDMRKAYAKLRIIGDDHANELLTTIRSIESEIWSMDRWPDEYEPVRQSVYSGGVL
jgi:hypothetical protein